MNHLRNNIPIPMQRHYPFPFANPARTVGLLAIALSLIPTDVFAIVDTNSDGVSDVWARYYSAESLTLGNDEDSDGWSNLEESVAGTDPFDPASFPQITGTDEIQDGLLFRWTAVAGMDYRIETSNGTLDGVWSTVRTVTAASTGNMVAVIPRPSNPTDFFRVAVQANPLGSVSFKATFDDDTDGDGLTDLAEFKAGTDPFSASSKLAISDFEVGSGLRVDFSSIPGKRYQLQKSISESGGGWQNEGQPILATGISTSVTLEIQESTPLLRLTVGDSDSDSDGATDWEEQVTGLDPLRDRTKGGTATDVQTIQELLQAPVRYTTRVRRPTVILGRTEPGMFELRRASGLGPAKVALLTGGTAVAGTDIAPIPTSVTIPIGEDQLLLLVTVLPGATADRAITMDLLDPSLASDESGPAEVRIFAPTMISVKDFGAIGDGVTDDTGAIQAAIDSLEATPLTNTLFFPAGTYRLNSHFPCTETPQGNRRILKLGNSDLSGRDLLFLGEPGSKLESTVSPQRAHMLLVMGSFRSLEFRGMTFEKNEIPLGLGIALGADGVSLVRQSSNKIASVDFDDCVFRNCHSSVAVYGNGYNIRGHLENLSFTRCKILNPYGANTFVGNSWGGGQQVPMGAWVGTASYRDCLFEGGSDDMTDHNLSPAGRLKDGCHFGSPLRLEFRNNVVRNMGVEAVYQLNRSLYMGTTTSEFIMPPSDGMTQVAVTTQSEDTTYTPGQILNFRTLTTGASAGKNNILRLLDWNSGTGELILVNDGLPGNSDAGSLLGNALPIYLQEDRPGIVDIRDNFIDGTLPPGAEHSDATGIVLDTRGIVKGNAIIGFGTSVLNYTDSVVPLFPGTRGLIVEENFIKVRHPDDSPGPVSYGIQTQANEISIVRNLISCPVSRRSVGVALRGNNARVTDNRIIALEPMNNGYTSNQRAVGILVGNTSYGTMIIGNTTQNFDVGVGPQANQWIIHSVSDHTSINDVLAIDPVGLVDP